MHNCKLLIVIIIMLFLFLGGCSVQRADTYQKAEGGVLDLTHLQLENDVVSLDGQWEFYWNQLLNPDELEDDAVIKYANVPGSWNKYKLDENAYLGNGYGTYRLTVITDSAQRVALKIPRIRTAYKLFVNGELIAEAGAVGTTRDTMIPQYLTKLSFFETQQGENEILIQVSNFYNRTGGMLESLKFGSEQQILELKLKNVAIEFIIFGSLICIGIYHLAVFFFGRKKNSSTMYFGLFCILMGIRTLFVGECFFFYLFPRFSWEIAHKILTLTYYLGVPLMLMFFMSIFPDHFHSRIIKIAQILGMVFSFVLLITPARVFTVANILYQIWSIGIIIYILSLLVKICMKKEQEGWLISLGALALLISSTNDIIFFSPLMSDNEFLFLQAFLRVGNLTSLGQFVFACTNSLLIAKRFSDSLEQEEIMTARLIEINTHLDELVLQRTKDLAESNKKIEQQNLELEKKNKALKKLSLKDSLTGIWNRRKYEQKIAREWHRCLREQSPIALLFLDIDYFKKFNDFYGHMAGDECLAKIGQVLKNSFVYSTGTVARYGGEEFVVLLTKVGKEEAIKTADLLRQSVEALAIPHEKSSINNYVTVSIGCTSRIPDLNTSYQDLVRVADKALYQAKDAGRNQVKFLEE